MNAPNSTYRGPAGYVAAVGANLLGRQHLPVERAAEAMADCFGAPVSTGWLSCLLPTTAARLQGVLGVAHFDETGGRVTAKLRWIHVACTNRWTVYQLASGRG